MPAPLRLSLSQSYTLRWPGIEKVQNGAQVDPRPLYTVEFQLLLPGATAFGSWAGGTWEPNAPPAGPYAAICTVGAGQPAGVNPGAAGIYRAWGHLVANNGSEDPAFEIGVIVFSAP